MPSLLINPHRRTDHVAPAPAARPREVHRRLPGYRPTPLLNLPDLARRCGLARLDIKDESDRLGLPAYKVLGAAWATCRALEQRLGHSLEPWRDLAVLRARLAGGPRLKLVTATDGNHGRGVARVARWLGFEAEIYLPQGSAGPRIAGIASEGAHVFEVPGTYDEAVARAASVVGEDILLIQDHGWPGYEEIPEWVAEGYETIFAEIEETLTARGEPGPDLVLVQIGVGTLAAATVRHFRQPVPASRPLLVGVEPDGAACALRSVEAGEPVLLSVGADASIMAGLNCGTPSWAAWPALRDAMDAFVSVEDDRAREAVRLLAAAGIVSGESGAAGLAGLLELMEPRHAAARTALGLGRAPRVLLISTEGATDPAGWERIVGRAPGAPA